MKKQINKLVRDNIPSICKENNQTPLIRILDENEYTSALRKKLKEEVEEYLSSHELEELADILEVIEALARDQASSIEEIMAIKREKQKRNGAFDKRIFLISVDADDASDHI